MLIAPADGCVLATELSPPASAEQLARSAAQDRIGANANFDVSMLSATPHPRFGSDCAAAGPVVIGVDEAGRGPLAGPVVAAAVVLCRPRPAGIGDSKKLTAARRASVDEAVRRRCAWAVGVVEPGEIDALNIFGATMLAMTLAVERLCALLDCDPHQVLVDGNLTPAGRRPEWRWPARAIVGGDGREPCIGAASVVAKEWRDRLMRDYAAQHPEYGWDRNKGYGTADHLHALRTYGPTPLHRRSFAPVAQQELFA